MELSFGIDVREHGYSIGRLAGVEADRSTRIAQNIIVSPDGTVTSNAQTRPLVDVPADHFAGDINLRGFPAMEKVLAGDDALLLTHQTRVIRGGRQIGRLSGLEVAAETGEIMTIIGRQHWWTRRFHLPAADLDFSVPGEIRVVTARSRAA